MTAFSTLMYQLSCLLQIPRLIQGRLRRDRIQHREPPLLLLLLLVLPHSYTVLMMLEVPVSFEFCSKSFEYCTFSASAYPHYVRARHYSTPLTV